MAVVQTAQGARQASVRTVTGTAWTDDGDWHALFDAAAIATGTYDERMLGWLNLKLSQSYANLPQALQALADANGACNFSSLGTFDASTSGSPIELDFSKAAHSGYVGALPF